jgi:hypothetical protein
MAVLSCVGNDYDPTSALSRYTGAFTVTWLFPSACYGLLCAPRDSWVEGRQSLLSHLTSLGPSYLGSVIWAG